jgi:hypothetical protein
VVRGARGHAAEAGGVPPGIVGTAKAVARCPSGRRPSGGAPPPQPDAHGAGVLTRGPPTRDDPRRRSPLVWACLAALVGVVVWFWLIDKRAAAAGTAAALLGCLGLILPPRERMALLPWRLRALPRRYDAVPALATLLSSPGYGLNWFHGANPYDEVVHLLNGALAGAVFAALVQADGRRRGALRSACAGAAFGLGLGVAWETFEWAADLVGGWSDTWTDVALTTAGATLAVAWGAGRGTEAPAAARRAASR